MESEEIHRRIAAGLSQRTASAAGNIGGTQPDSHPTPAPIHTSQWVPTSSSGHSAHSTLPHQMGPQPTTTAGLQHDPNIGPHPATGGMFPGMATPMNGGAHQGPPGFQGLPGYGTHTTAFGYPPTYGLYTQVSVPILTGPPNT